MAHYERSIKLAFDKITGEVLDADEVFKKTKDAFVVRRKFHNNELDLYCCECEQKLNISTSKNDRLHFKHNSNADYCILKDGKLTPEQIDLFNKILYSKESPRHKELKQKIGDKLLYVDGVEKDSIAIDNRFILKEDGKRKPDVYCKYKGNELVFEIQLSTLSLSYILSRYEFYKRHGIYLIWILDDFDLHDQKQLERDIKYLTQYENFFKLDENEKEFRLHCDYKYPFLTDDNQLLTKWLTKPVTLKDLNFDNNCYQVYYFNFALKKEKEEEYQKRIFDAIEKEKLKNVERSRRNNANIKSHLIVEEIKGLKNDKIQSYHSAYKLIYELDEYQRDVLNEKLRLKGLNKIHYPLHKWIEKATKDHNEFISFLLNCTVLEFDLNEVDQEGYTVFQKVILNNELHNNTLIKGLLKRNYELVKRDELTYFQWLESNPDITNNWLLYSFCNRLKSKYLVDDVFKHYVLLCIIESAKCNEIIGFNYKKTEWIAFANNAIQYHKEYWEYIELAFKHYGLWETIIPLDKKGTFQKKLEQFYSAIPPQHFDVDSVFEDLYPELME
ncbi:MAG: DUF6035 family protein [Reichenbachiella sp.]|uniref:DUF6035 family protein n=1 Tax=Reichenbachiella sp. TaxID=2184521 RepID=UPI00329A4992